MKKYLFAAAFTSALALAGQSGAVPCQTITRVVPYQVCQTAHGQTRCRTFQRTVTRRVCMYNQPSTGPSVRLNQNLQRRAD